MSTLEELRKQIDILDSQLLDILRKRLDVVDGVGKTKKELGISPLDMNRWNQVLETQLKKAELLGLRKEFVKKILDTIHEEALLIEEKYQ